MYTRNDFAYNWPPAKLLDTFMQASARAGVSGSGLVIDLSSGTHSADATYLKGVLLARLEGAVPELKPGDKVRATSSLLRPLTMGDWRVWISSRNVKGDLTISKILYLGNKSWAYQFKEENEMTAYKDGIHLQDENREWWVPLWFHAKNFEAVALATSGK
jgi:hypothetical protein